MHNPCPSCICKAHQASAVEIGPNLAGYDSIDQKSSEMYNVFWSYFMIVKIPYKSNYQYGKVTYSGQIHWVSPTPCAVNMSKCSEENGSICSCLYRDHFLINAIQEAARLSVSEYCNNSVTVHAFESTVHKVIFVWCAKFGSNFIFTKEFLSTCVHASNLSCTTCHNIRFSFRIYHLTLRISHWCTHTVGPVLVVLQLPPTKPLWRVQIFSCHALFAFTRCYILLEIASSQMLPPKITVL